MEKSNRPVKASWSELKDGEGQIVDADFLVDLLETYRFGKDNFPAREFRFKAAATAPAPVNTVEIEEVEDNDGSQGTYIVNYSTCHFHTCFFCLLIFGTSISLIFQLRLLVLEFLNYPKFINRTQTCLTGSSISRLFFLA